MLTKQLNGWPLSSSFAIPLRYILRQNSYLNSTAYCGIICKPLDKNMADLSQYDIDNRIKYLEEAKSLDFLNAVFCIYFYNTDVKRWGPRPKPEDISPDEVFGCYTEEEFNQAIDKCKKLINHGRKLGDLTFDRKEVGEQKFQKERAVYEQSNVGFNKKNLDRASNSGMRDMR